MSMLVFLVACSFVLMSFASENVSSEDETTHNRKRKNSAYQCRPCGQNINQPYKDINESPLRHLFNTHVKELSNCFFCDIPYPADMNKSEFTMHNNGHMEACHTELLVGLMRYCFVNYPSNKLIKTWNKEYRKKLKAKDSSERDLLKKQLICDICKEEFGFYSALFHAAEKHWFLQEKTCCDISFASGKKKKYHFLFAIKHTMRCKQNSLNDVLQKTFPAIQAEWQNNVLIVTQSKPTIITEIADTVNNNSMTSSDGIMCTICSHLLASNDSLMHIASHFACIIPTGIKCPVCGQEFNYMQAVDYMLHNKSQHKEELSHYLSTIQLNGPQLLDVDLISSENGLPHIDSMFAEENI
jgi:hypothetical protein